MSAPISHLFQAARKPDGRLPVSYLKILFLHSPPLKLSYDIALTEGVIVLVLTSLLYQPLKEIPAPPQYRIRNNTVRVQPGRVLGYGMNSWYRAGIRCEIAVVQRLQAGTIILSESKYF